VQLRAAARDDETFLWDMLALAAREPSADAARAEPFAAKHLAGWPREGDFGIVAVDDGAPVGAAWARQLTPAEEPSFFVAHGVPEVTVGVLAPHRGHGVGHALLVALADEARARGLAGLTLNVRHDNPALRLYARAGFHETGVSVANRVGGRSIGMLLDLAA
jgi:ribosomal protein S18 acetylase RimI-like enzyme